MSRSIKKVAVLGSGVMGSRIACHFANIGVEVLLLDIVPRDLSDEEKQKPAMRNKLVNDALQFALKSKPSPIYDKSFASLVSTGNFEDDMSKISEMDWIIEVVVERLDIKKIVFDQVEKYRKPGTLITSNTSGIPMHMMCEERSEDFKKHFCGTHFFNPPRYLRLLEIIPGPETDPEIIDFLMHYGDVFLGKESAYEDADGRHRFPDRHSRVRQRHRAPTRHARVPTVQFGERVRRHSLRRVSGQERVQRRPVSERAQATHRRAGKEGVLSASGVRPSEPGGRHRSIQTIQGGTVQVYLRFSGDISIDANGTDFTSIKHRLASSLSP